MTATGEAHGDLAGAIALLWEPRPQPKRGPRPTLNLEIISRAGIEIADADGIAALTMQRVAEALGRTKMSLYRYVPGKFELLSLMTDTALGRPEPMDTEGWRPRLHTWATRMFDLFWHHPWTLETTVGVRAIGPNELDWTEQALAALTGTALDGGEMLDVVATLAGHVRAIAEQSTAMASRTPEQALDAAMSTLLKGRERRFPALAAALDSMAQSGTQDQALEFGLHRILDGVELLIGARA